MVGVVSEVKYVGLDKPDEGTVYWPHVRDVALRYLVLRTTTDPVAVLPAVRQVMRELDPSAAAVERRDDRRAGRAVARDSRDRCRCWSGASRWSRSSLSIVGIYGVMAYYVQQHTKDISIRLALGGSSGDVLRLVVGQGMTVVGERRRRRPAGRACR